MGPTEKKNKKEMLVSHFLNIATDKTSFGLVSKGQHMGPTNQIIQKFLSLVDFMVCIYIHIIIYIYIYIYNSNNKTRILE